MEPNIEQILRENIAKTYHLSLATCKDNQPWVTELHFAYDDDLNLYFRSLGSARHSQELTANPKVSGTIVKQFGLDEYPLGVYFEGTAQLLGPGPEQMKAFECIKDRLKASEETLSEAANPEGHQFYKVAIETYYVFGKFTEDGGQKYELKWGKA